MRKLSLIFFLSTTIFLSTASAIQEFESNVVEQKFNSSSTIIIDQKEIQKSRAKDLTTLLATQANISITQSNFQPNTIYLRGGDSSHVLILVDGVPFYDATTVQRTVNLNSLNLKSIQRIEVIKGSQSVLFGGQALSGVIKIDTIPKEIKSMGFVQTQAGTQQSTSLAGGLVQPIAENQGIVARASYSKKENPSPILDSKKIYPSRLGTAEIAHTLRNSEIETLAKIQTSFDKTLISSTDKMSFTALDADNFETSNYQLSGTLQLKFLEIYGRPHLLIASQKSERIYEQDSLSAGGMATKREYLGNLQLARLDFMVLDFKNLKTQAGLSFTDEKLNYRSLNKQKTDAGTDYQGMFVKVDYIPASFFTLSGGARVDTKKMKDPINTYQIGATIMDQIRLEHSTGFKQPSLFQLYADYANIDLQPEKSTSNSISYEKNITSDWSYAITGFETKFTNLIVVRGPILQYQNIAESQTRGVEATTGLRFPDSQFSVNLSLGYQEPRDFSTDTWLVRRPLRIASLRFRKQYDKLAFGLEGIHNGDRRDITIISQTSTTYTTLDAYTYLNATVEYQKNEYLTFFARGQNLTNNRYETSYTFYDEGINLSVGAETIF